jgi:hypothetical protein
MARFAFARLQVLNLYTEWQKEANAVLALVQQFEILVFQDVYEA